MSVRQQLSKALTQEVHFAHPVHLQGIRVKFIYKGHRVKVKVTGANNVENTYIRNVKLRSAITLLP